MSSRSAAISSACVQEVVSRARSTPSACSSSSSQRLRERAVAGDVPVRDRLGDEVELVPEQARAVERDPQLGHRTYHLWNHRSSDEGKKPARWNVRSAGRFRPCVTTVIRSAPRYGAPRHRRARQLAPEAAPPGGLVHGDQPDRAGAAVKVARDVPDRRPADLGDEHSGSPALQAAADPGVVEELATFVREVRVGVEARPAVAPAPRLRAAPRCRRPSPRGCLRPARCSPRRVRARRGRPSDGSRHPRPRARRPRRRRARGSRGTRRRSLRPTHRRLRRRVRVADHTSDPTPQNSVSQSSSSAARQNGPHASSRADLLADRVGRPIHHAQVHAREVLADDPEREELRAREDRDHRREKREARHAAAANE